MKSFFSALAIFLLMLGMIVWNYFYIEKTCDTLMAKIEQLPPCEQATAPTSELIDYWEGESSKIGISTSQHTIDKMNDCLAELCYAVANQDAQFFERARYRSISILKEIQDAESLQLENWV